MSRALIYLVHGLSPSHFTYKEISSNTSETLNWAQTFDCRHALQAFYAWKGQSQLDPLQRGSICQESPYRNTLFPSGRRNKMQGVFSTHACAKRTAFYRISHEWVECRLHRDFGDGGQGKTWGSAGFGCSSEPAIQFTNWANFMPFLGGLG
jgi:hypothetical protein